MPHRAPLLAGAAKLRPLGWPDDPAALDEAQQRTLFRTAWDSLPIDWRARWRGKARAQADMMEQMLTRRPLVMSWLHVGQGSSSMDCVLFLDDDHARHARFRLRMGALGHPSRHQLLYVFTAAEAIAALRAHEGEIAHAFLDHDLCEDDHCVTPGAPSKVPTGMAVVDHIVTMRQPPAKVTVHSFNYLAALEMCARLSRLPNVAIQHIPFTELLDQLDPLV